MSGSRLSGSVVAWFILCFWAAMARAAGPATNAIWHPLEQVPQTAAVSAGSIRPKTFRAFKLDHAALRSLLARAPLESDHAAAPLDIPLPMPDGSLTRFRVCESSVMAPGLAAKFPRLHTYRGQSADDPSATVRFDYTPAGFHAQILSPRGAVYLDPLERSDTNVYACYLKRDYQRPEDGFHCLTAENPPLSPNQLTPLGLSYGDNKLRTYRLACAATAEYVAFQSAPAAPNVPAGMAAIVTAINRVNGIYETELSIRLVLVANNDQIIFTDTNSEPYQNFNGTAMLSENQTTIDSIIGDSNYDIGHVFSTGGGGIADVGVVCQSGLKAYGVTGLPQPVGDSFYVDYVAHEMGHEFGAHHPFNGLHGNCAGSQRYAPDAFEPGSGSTIMAYAGICGSDDLQPHSDPYFHSVSLAEIINYTTQDGGNGCAVLTSTGRTGPNVNAGANFIIPLQTPFSLSATGSDTNGALTYCWEERDLGPAQSLGSPDNGSSPLFRSFSPTTNRFRTFPQMSDLLGGTNTPGEQLPAQGRTMNFRVTARDNQAGGGAVSTADMQVTVDSGSGPFAVTSPAAGVTWCETRTVLWDVAGTTNDPVDAARVNILLSTNGGTNFPITLAANIPNNGVAAIVLPVISAAHARVRVEVVSNIFFALSPGDFTIIPETNPPPVLAPIADRTIHQGFTLTITNVATDPVVPPHTLAYSLNLDAPPSAVINPSTGVFQWTPTANDIGTTNLFTVTVADNADTVLNDSQSFNVVVVGPPEIQSFNFDGAQINLTWTAIPGDNYILQSTTNLAAPHWADVSGSEITANDVVATNAVAVNSSVAIFYRVRLAP